MTDSKFFIKYGNKEPEQIDSQFLVNGTARIKPLTRVGDLIAVYRQISVLASAPIELISLHHPVTGECLSKTTLLTFLKKEYPSLGTFEQPFIIKYIDDNAVHPLSYDPFGTQLSALLGMNSLNVSTASCNSKPATVEKVISQLHETNVLLVTVPMNDRASMAQMVSETLHRNAIEKCLLINFSMRSCHNTDWTFEKAFKTEVGLKWSETVSISQHRFVYLVIDEFQAIYQRRNYDNSSSIDKFSVLWSCIKAAMSNRHSRIRYMLFADYAPSTPQNTRFSTPVEFVAGETWLELRND